MADSVFPAVRLKWKEKCDVRVQGTALEAVDFFGLILLLLPILLEAIMGKFSAKTAEQMKEHIKEAGRDTDSIDSVWTRMLMNIKARQLTLDVRQDFKMSRSSARHAAVVLVETLLSGIVEEPEVVDGVVNETDGQRSRWEGWV